jgi:hypothetical protein
MAHRGNGNGGRNGRGSRARKPTTGEVIRQIVVVVIAAAIVVAVAIAVIRSGG